MTPQFLDFDAPVTRSRPRREKTRTELVIDYFQRFPNQWIDGLVFEDFAGKYAWSARIREARRLHGMQIDNRVRVVEGGRKVSEYRFVPTVSAREGE